MGVTNEPLQVTPEERRHLLDLASKATPGPWMVEECANDHGVTYQHIYSDVEKGTGQGVADTWHENAFEMSSIVAVAFEKLYGRKPCNRTEAPVRGRAENAEYIVAACNLTPLLLANLQAVEAEVAVLRERIESARTKLADLRELAWKCIRSTCSHPNTFDLLHHRIFSALDTLEGK